MICFVSNSCSTIEVYIQLNNIVNLNIFEYPSPFIGHLFLDDISYLRFVKNYDYYIKIDPIFIIPEKRYNWKDGDIKYPVMKLDDIEIHWIHDDSSKLVMKKWVGRLSKSKNLDKIFLWSASEMLQKHSVEDRKKMIDEFMSIKYPSIFLTDRKEDEYNEKNHICRFIESWKIGRAHV